MLSHFSYCLFLDDVRRPNQAIFWEIPRSGMPFLIESPLVEWITVRSYEEFVQQIKAHGIPRLVSFDHDLAPEHYHKRDIRYDQYSNPTGYDCARWLIDFCKQQKQDLPRCLCHSYNNPGRMNITAAIQNYYRKYEIH